MFPNMVGIKLAQLQTQTQIQTDTFSYEQPSFLAALNQCVCVSMPFELRIYCELALEGETVRKSAT